MLQLFKWAAFGALFSVCLYLWIRLDINRVVFNHTPGKNCHYIAGVENGSRDIHVLSNGLALIVSEGSVDEGIEGKVYLYNAKNPEEKSKRLRIMHSNQQDGDKFDEKMFQPSHVTSWENKEKETTFIYITNTFKPEICVFELKLKSLEMEFIKSLSNPMLTNPNDIVAIEQDQFYVANFLQHSHSLLSNLEMALNFSTGSVLYYDGQEFIRVVKNLPGPSGLGLSNNKLYLYVALSVGRELIMYKIESKGRLSKTMQIPMKTSLDNINVDSKGGLWIAAQPSLHKALLHFHNPKLFSAPSQVIKISFHRKGGHDIEEVFANDGSNLQFATSAAIYNDVLIIGTLRHRAMWCRLTDYHSLYQMACC